MALRIKVFNSSRDQAIDEGGINEWFDANPEIKLISVSIAVAPERLGAGPYITATALVYETSPADRSDER